MEFVILIRAAIEPTTDGIYKVREVNRAAQTDQSDFWRSNAPTTTAGIKVRKLINKRAPRYRPMAGDVLSAPDINLVRKLGSLTVRYPHQLG